MGYLDGVENREDITEELKKEVQRLRQKLLEKLKDGS